MRRTSREAMPAAGTTTPRAGRSRSSINALDVLIALAATVLAVVWSAGIVPSDSESGQISDTDALWVLASLIGLASGPILHVPVHELGHLLAAQALRLRVVGVRVWNLRFGRPDQALAGTSGHVRVELANARRWLPVRVSLFALAGPAANVAVAVATATTVIANRSASTGLRTLAVGVTVSGLSVAIASLAPRRPTSDHETDGRLALRWIFRPADARTRIAITTGRAHQRVISPLTETRMSQQRRLDLLTAIEDGSPEIAVAAMTELLRWRPRWDDGWQDFDVVARFAARGDLSADVRAKVGGQYSLSLALAHLVAGPGEPTDPDSPNVRRMEQLAELALAANHESLPARTAVGLVRIIQDRPVEARALLTDAASTASPAARARAYAVRGIAEIELGDLDQARGLATLARRVSPNDSSVKLLDTFLASKAPR